MTELANCPFCGGPAKLTVEYDRHGAVYDLGCVDKACIAYMVYYQMPQDYFAHEEAVELWNRRAAPPTSPPQWRPMAEAPERDGINVLVSWWGETLIAWKHGAYWYTADAYGEADAITPEAWMPLPDPLPYPSRTISD